MSPALPRVTVTTGDPAGIGPELVARLLAEVGSTGRILLISSAAEIERGLRRAGLDLTVRDLLGGAVELREVDSAPVEVTGEASAAGGAWSLRALEQALDACTGGAADAVVFGPLNKTSLHLAGMVEPDELRWLERAMGAAGPVSEVNVNSVFWTSRVTSHVPLREVAGLITPEKVADCCVLLDGLLRADGRAAPRIAVCALNPHAGESGRFGDEESRLIAPGIALAGGRGVDASGPYPADTVFRRGFDGTFDGIVTMYHDQGQIALKSVAFDGGVTLEAGLGLPICTPAHGTAFDLVGTGRANLDSLRNAYHLATRLAGHSGTT